MPLRSVQLCDFLWGSSNGLSVNDVVQRSLVQELWRELLFFDLSEERLPWCEPILQRVWYSLLGGGNYVRPQCNADWKL